MGNAELQLYLGTLEATKAEVAERTSGLGLSPVTSGSVTNFVGGAAASLASQLVVVPVDVVSQRLMIQVCSAGVCTLSGY